MRAFPPDLGAGSELLDPARSSYDSRMQVGSLLRDRDRFIINNPGDPVGAQTLTVSTTLVRLTLPSDAVSAVFQVTVAPIRWTVGGVDPAAAVGFHHDVNDVFGVLGRAGLLAWQAVREGAADATVFVQFFG